MDTVTQAETTAEITTYIHQLQLEDLHPATVAKYHQCLKTFQDWLGGQPIAAYTAKQFLAYLRQQGYAPNSVELYYHALKPFLESLGIPFKVKFKKRRKLPAYHGPHEVTKLLQVINQRQDTWKKLGERDKVMVLVMAYTGIRRAELLALTARDVNFSSRAIRVSGKGDRDRVIPIAPPLYQPLFTYTRNLKPGQRLFPIQPKRLWTIVTGYARKAGINDFHPHSFRHFCATQLVEAGVSLKAIQQILGHADITTTAVYIDLVPKHLQDAVDKLPTL